MRCDYINGKISSFKELLSTIAKIFFTAVIAIISVGLESKLAVALAPMMTPLVASFVAPALAIIVGSIAVVTMSKTIDFALETLFGVFAQAEISKNATRKSRLYVWKSCRKSLKIGKCLLKK